MPEDSKLVSTIPLSVAVSTSPAPSSSPPNSAASSSNANNSLVNEEKPSFNYDLDLFNLCQAYLESKNHHGLALIARQKGLPPFLRFKIWPILLKYHPFVLNPFIQPDNEIIKKKGRSNDGSNGNSNNSSSTRTSISTCSATATSGSSESDSTDDQNSIDEIKSNIKKDLGKYIQRLKYPSSFELSTVEVRIFEILENSILKFITKWGKIIKYDQALTWIALNLAEWFPPINDTPWVLIGRDNSNKNSYIKNIFDDYSNYIDSLPNLNNYLNDLIQDNSIIKMSFHDVYERLVLVLLHSPEEKIESHSSAKKINKTILPINGGTIEERVSFFIYCLRKLLPELSQFFQEEQILNKFSNYDDEWLIWWLKYCGSKVWSKYDRGRIWDLILGWRLKNPKKDMDYYIDKLDINKNIISKLGPDIFWSVGEEDDDEKDSNKLDSKRSNSFKDLITKLNDLNVLNESSTTTSSTITMTSNSPSSSPSSPPSSSNLKGFNIPFSKLDPHIELIFISLALLKSKENTLVELDQHEIRQYLSRLPTKSYKYKQKQKHPTESSNIIISNDSIHNHKVDFMDNIINEAGELWRKWLWSEMVEDN